MIRGTVCVNRARTVLWGLWEGNFPILPGKPEELGCRFAPADLIILIEPKANTAFWILYSGSWILFHVYFGRANFL